MSGGKTELFTRLRCEALQPGDVLLEPCYDGACDGPWHETGVATVTTDAADIVLTTLTDAGARDVLVRRREDRVHVLVPRVPARYRAHRVSG